MKAFVRTDPLEDPVVLQAMQEYLGEQGLQCHFTEKSFKELYYPEPFLYFRNPYLRIDRAYDILSFHHQNPNFYFIKTKNNEPISFNSHAPLDNYFVVNNLASHIIPPSEPLPILVGIYKRPIYAKLTLNSIRHNLYDQNQRVYIAISQADAETESLVQEFLDKDTRFQAVKLKNNVGYALHNFGSKFFGLKKFLHVEDDAILPEKLNYLLPCWDRQLNYRTKTSKFVSFRVSDRNYTSNFYKSNMFIKGTIPQLPEEGLWHYVKPPGIDREMLPVGGVASVVDSVEMYKGFQAPKFFCTDQIAVDSAKRVCILNIPVYHIGCNQEMDYPDYYWKKGTDRQDNIAQIQEGQDMRTGQIKRIDLAVDWAQGGVVD